MGDSYRPNRGPAQSRPPPLVDRMTFTAGGGGSDRYRPGDQRREQNGGRAANHPEFTFSAGHPGHEEIHFAPSGPANANGHGARKKRNRGGAASHDRGRGLARGGNSMPTHPMGRNSANGRGRGRYRKPAPHERALLQDRSDDTTEHVLGVADGPNKFRNLADLSDDEQDAMETDSEKSAGDAGSSVEGGTLKKVARTESTARADGDSVPKWSNPDPYTVLPPPEETTGKKKDVVQMIRKAKNDFAEKFDANNAVAANDDFISFGDLEEDDEPDMEDELPPVAPWAHPSSSRQPFHGSMNEVAATGALSAAGRDAKRTAEAADVPKRPQHSRIDHKRKRGELEGAVIGDWLPRAHTHPTPWATDHANARLANLPHQWLHNEIMDFYDWIKPQPHEGRIRNDLVARIEQAIGPNYFKAGTGHVYCFGSFPAGLNLPTADMDLVYASNQYSQGGPPLISCSKSLLWRLARKLEGKGIATKTTVIATAKVPIIKFVDKVTGIQVDLSFENLGGVHAQETLKRWRADYPDMVYLVALVKQFLAMRGMNEVHQGGLGGFSIICLVISFFQLQPKPESLGDAFLNFLDYYGNVFDMQHMRIRMDPPKLVRKAKVGIDGRPEKPDGLSIQDPNKADNNISGGSHKAKDVFRAFSNGHRALVERMNAIRNARLSETSILDAVLAGNYSSYEQQRKHMRNLKQ